MKIVMQDGIKDCGICCLLSVIRHYGGNVSKEYLRDITNTTKNGVSAYNLVEAAKKIGFNAQGVTGDMNNIKNNNLPCLAHLTLKKGYKHFVVIYKINTEKEKLTIMDPAKGKQTLSFSEFKLLSTNNYIFLSPLKPLPQVELKYTIKKNIKQILLKNKYIVIRLIILTIIYFLLNILTAFHFKYIINYIIEYNSTTNIENIFIIISFTSLLWILNGFLKDILLVKINSILDEKLTIKTLKQILSLPYLYYKNRTTGEITNRLKDLTYIKTFITQLINILVTDSISLIIFLSLLYSINHYLANIVAISTLLLFLFTTVCRKPIKKLYSKIRRKEDKVNSYLIETINNADTLKGNHLEKKSSDKFLLLYKSLLERNYKYLFFVEISNTVKTTIKNFSQLILYYISSIMILEKVLKITDIFLFQTFIQYYYDSLKNILYLLNEYHNYKISLERIEELFLIQNEKFVNSYYYNYIDLNGDIEFKNLTFQYGYKSLYDNLNLKIKKYEKILFVGESGSGKSSLVKILMRYIEVPYGMCLINNIDINHYHLEILRKKITYVTSNEFLFTDTLYNNLTLEKEITQDEIENVCKITKIDEIISARNTDYNVMIEENGFNFSNGERQRIILGRALLRNSDIYIFDEALSQIDTSKEKEILTEIFKKYKNKTFIIISHRLINSNLYDRIIELKKGKIYEKKI